MNISISIAKIQILVILALGVLLAGCRIFDSGESEIVFEYDFRESGATWQAFFTDYNVGWGESMNLTYEYRTLPKPLNTTDNAHFISAVNHSDDVKMLFRKQVDGLDPGTVYKVDFTIRFATEVPSGCAGIGGPPGEAVRVLAEASAIRPEAFIGGENEDYYLLNVQHINDPVDWQDDVIIGDIANSRECEEGYEYEIKEVRSQQYHRSVTTDEDGRAWLMFGTRSGFEGQTDLYYTYFRADFTR